MDLDPSRVARARHDRRIAARLALCFFLLYACLAHVRFSGSDEMGIFLTTRALYDSGDLALPPGKHIFPGRDGRGYSIFDPGQAVLALPFFALGRLGGRVLPATWIEHLAAEDSNLGPGGFELFAVLLLYPPLASGLLVALFFLVERRLGASRRSA